MPKRLLTLADAPSRRSGSPPLLVALGSLAAILLGAALLFGAAETAAQPPGPPATVVDILVLDEDDRPVSGLTAADFVVAGRGGAYRVQTAEERRAGEAARRFVFVFNRRGADAAQLNRALGGLGSFIEDRMLDADLSLFADLGETLHIGRAFGPGMGVALAGLETIPAMGYRSPAGAEDDAVVAARMLEMVADRLVAVAGRKIVALYSESLSSFARASDQPGTVRTSNLPRIRPHARGEPDAGLGSIIEPLHRANATMHVLHLAGVREFEEKILTAHREELIVAGSHLRGSRFSSTTREAPERAPSRHGGDDILSGLATATGGLYFARATGFRKALERIEARNRLWYRLTLVGETEAGERESGVLQVRVPGCRGCTVLPAPSPAPE